MEGRRKRCLEVQRNRQNFAYTEVKLYINFVYNSWTAIRIIVREKYEYYKKNG